MGLSSHEQEQPAVITRTPEQVQSRASYFRSRAAALRHGAMSAFDTGTQPGDVWFKSLADFLNEIRDELNARAENEERI